MEIIAHTALVNKTEDSLNQLLNNELYDKIELDFIQKGPKFIWQHNQFSKYDDKALTIDEVLEISNHRKPLLIEMKGSIPKTYDEYKALIKTLELLNIYDDIQVQRFNQLLIQMLLENRCNFNNIEIGLIINFFKTFIYRNGNVGILQDSDFISLSSELYEYPIVGKDNMLYREIFKRAKIYAWAWDFLYKENESRTLKYIENNADGIITGDPLLVKKLINS